MYPKHQKKRGSKRGSSSSWAWARTVGNDINLEHGLVAYFSSHTNHGLKCRNNCANNPRCLGGYLTDQPIEYYDPLDFEFLDGVRDSNSLVGLKNLGATCYMNSLLQLLFSNATFRNMILELDVQQPDTGAGDFKNIDVISNLQFLFAAMLHGNRKSVDPSDFVNSLNLEPSTQQDAHELLQLLLPFIDSHLSQSVNIHARDLIRNIFQGEYSYVTTCSVCCLPSVRSSTFYELDLNLSSSLYDSMLEFLRQEDLVGSDRYRCSVCMILTDAKRRIVLNVLPPVLILQIKRFFYDRNTGAKKKLNKIIKFPEVFDVSSFIDKPEQKKIYELAGILIHKGSSAYSGHYIVHTRDSNGNWYMFNDEETERISAKKLDKLYRIKSKVASDEAGLLHSSNVYMLMYTVKGFSDGVNTIEKNALQPHILKKLELFNNTMNERVKEVQTSQDQSDVTKKMAELSHIFNTFPAQESWEAISSKWLSHYVSATLAGKPVNKVENSRLLCIHGKLSLNFSLYKYISRTAADQLFEQFGGSPRFSSPDSFCLDCVKIRVLDIKYVSDINQVHREFIAPRNKSIESAEGNTYWVGRKSLKIWKRLALEANPYAQVERPVDAESSSDTPVEDESVPKENGKISTSNVKLSPPSAEEKNDSLPENEGDESPKQILMFNEDLVCKHGCLVADEDSRKLISESMWIKLSTYFGDSVTFPGSTSPCSICQEDLKLAEIQFEENRSRVQVEKSSLSHLAVKNVKLPKFGHYAVLSNEHFMTQWRNFIRNWKDVCPRPTSLNIGKLYCAHGKLAYDLTTEEDLKEVSFIDFDSWQKLQHLYSLEKDEDNIPPVFADFDRGVITEVSLETCHDCVQTRQALTEAQRSRYSQGIVYIRMLNKPGDENDFELLTDNPEYYFPTTSTSAPYASSSNVRRSGRKRAVKGDVSVRINSSDTLSVLRSKIYDRLRVLPYAQRLSLENGRVLTEDLKLAELGIRPYNIIYLQTDFADEDFFSTCSRGEPERGFKGSSLIQ